MPDTRVVKKSERSQSPARFGGNNPSESARSLERGVGAGLKATKSKSVTKANGGKLKHKTLNND